MKFLNVEGKIVDLKSYLIAQKEGLKSIFFTTNNLTEVLDSKNKDTDLSIRINCDGGYIREALQIYDMLRMSGKNISANIENGCHSSGILVLLSAPKEKRTSNYNATALIHEPRASIENKTADEMREIAIDLDEAKSKLLDIYVERTGTDRVILEALMNEEKERTPEELLKYGFISKINNYNTNLKTNQMAEMTNEVKDLLSTTEKFMVRIKNLFTSQITNYAFKDSEGNVLFTTDKEDESLEVGDMATPDGTYEVNNNTIVIAGGKIESITPIADDSEAMNVLQAENASLKEQIENLKSQSANLETKVTEFTNLIEESKTVITNLKATVTSNFQVPARVSTPAKVTNTAKTSEERKAEIKENRNKLKNQ